MNLYLKKKIKIKVCFVSLYAYHLFKPKNNSRFGGAEVQLYYLAAELAKDKKFDVHFVVGDFNQSSFEIIRGVKLYKFFNPNSKLKYIRGVFAFIRLWKLLKKINANIYMQRAAGLETGEVALFAKINKKKFIYMAANDEDVNKKFPSYLQKKFIHFIRWQLFKFGLKNSDLIFIQNESQKNNLKNNYNKKGIIRKSAHYIDNIKFNIKKDFILWVGKADSYIKQPKIFIDLARSFPKKKFIIICPISNDENYFKKIKNEAKKILNLKFIDYVPFNEIDDYFLKAKIFINTSKTEGFPNTFIQATKNRTPILSLNVNPDKILEKYNIGKCAYGDFNKMKKYLEYFLNNNNSWQTMSNNAFKYADKNHNLKKIIQDDKKTIFKLAEVVK